MEAPRETLSLEEHRKKGYLMAVRLKGRGIDTETIREKMVDEGIPRIVANQVIEDLTIEKQRSALKERDDSNAFDLHKILVRLGLTAIASLITMYFFPGKYAFPITIISGGIISVFFERIKREF